MPTIIFKFIHRKKFFAAKKLKSTSILLLVQGVARCYPCDNFSVYDVQRNSRCFATGPEDRYKNNIFLMLMSLF